MNSVNSEHTLKKTLLGAVNTGSGSIAYAKLKMKNGRWTVGSADSWPTSNVLKTILLLSGGTALGVCAEWHKKTPGSDLEPPVSNANADANPYLYSTESDLLGEAFSDSVTAIVADDSYLLTLPLAFCDNPAYSFLSVYYENGVVTIGVVIKRRLEAVFSFPCDAASCVEASAARVRRYWIHALKREDFPRKAVIFNGQNDNCDGLNVEPLALPKELNGSDAIKAAGAALAVLYPAPAFRLPSQYSFKKFRPLLLSIFTILACLSIIMTLISVSINYRAGRRLAYSEKSYYSRLSENKALQTLNRTAEELSAEILSVNKAYAQTTCWKNLLLLLSELKPDDLFLDRLGSDNIQGSENSVRLALSGWSKTETSVTEFISGLQASDYIDNVSLSSIERDAKDKNFCRFRVICVMRLFKD